MRVIRKVFNILTNLKGFLFSYFEYLNFRKMMDICYPEQISISFPVKILPKEYISPFEFFDYYAVFYYWVCNDLYSFGSGKKILSLGGVKMGDAIISLRNEVYSMVLCDPKDKISKVKYIVMDISDLKENNLFEENFFDVFLSPATLHLIGLGRYGDKLNPCAIFDFIVFLKKVLKKGGYIYICIPMGKPALIFNRHWIYDFETIKKIFCDFEVVDYFVDEWAGYPGLTSPTDIKAMGGIYVEDLGRFDIQKERFSKDIDVENLGIGQYKILYLKMRK